jgi:bifunctional non-homologous end joining protein LigD
VCPLKRLNIPPDADDFELALPQQTVRLTNLQKLFWAERGIYKRDLLQYYLEVSPLLLPHLRERAMVMKRYPNGIEGGFFFMKRAPVPRPSHIQVCSIEHASKNVIDFPVVGDLASLLWMVNLGCIDLNPWYARCDDVNRPDYLHFDLDPGGNLPFNAVLQAALVVRDALDELGMPSYPKTSGSRGMHIYVPIVRGPLQKQVWTVAKQLAKALAQRRPDLITAEYRIAKRPARRVLVDYNQNAWGRTLASLYSVRPTPAASVSTPLRWEEVERGVKPEDFRIETVMTRFEKFGDLWKPLLWKKGRFSLSRLERYAA